MSEGRPVRLIVDGWATTMTDSHGEDTSAVRVRYAAPEREASVLVLTSSPNVTVEDREAPHVWTDGDVIDHAGEVFVRAGGEWRTVVANRPRLDDAAASRTLHLYPLTTSVVRHQAGA